MLGSIGMSITKMFAGDLTHQRSAAPSKSTGNLSQAFQEELMWPLARKLCAKILRSGPMEAFIGTLVMLNFVLVVVETDVTVKSEQVPAWLSITNYVLLGIYIVELGMRLYVLRLKFFRAAFNVMDLVIVLVDVVGELVQLFSTGLIPSTSLTLLRVLRLMRLARGVKVMVKLPQLALMVRGLVSAVSALFWGVCLLVVVLTVWGILAVQFIHPVNLKVAESGIYDGCSRCEHAFESVAQSMLTFTQTIIAGDSWGLVTVPIIEEAPLSAMYFLLVFVSVHLAIMNVILAVIVDSALKASQDDVHEVVKKKTSEFNSVKNKLRQICADMDQDNSHDLTLQELLEGFDSNFEFQEHLMSMDVKKEDMNAVFSILDSDESGSVNYDEFIEELHKMKTHDAHTLLVFIKFYVVEVRKLMLEQLRVFRNDVIGKIEAQRIGPPPSFGAGLLVEEKKQAPPLAVQVEPAKELGEELRQLRMVISEDLVRSMREMSQRSESHTRLLASIAGEAATAPPPGGGAVAGASPERPAAALVPGLRLAAIDIGRGGLQGGPCGQMQPRSAWSGSFAGPRGAGPSVGTPAGVCWGTQGCCSAEKASDGLTISHSTPKA